MSARKPFAPSPTGAAHRPPSVPSRSLLGIALLALLVFAAGCRSGTSNPVPNPSAVAAGDADWFCGAGDEDGEWACVQDQELRDAVPMPPPARA